MSRSTRREFLQQTASLGAIALGAGALTKTAWAAPQLGEGIRLGMVTYTWGQDWDLPTLLANMEKAKFFGVELRTSHAHKVEPTLSPAERAEVKKRFADSPVKLVGLGSTQDYHRPDPAAVEKSIEETKEFIKLSHDVGGTGVKVRPNDLPKDIPIEKTTEQIGKALNVVGRFAADYGQEIRLEVHGSHGSARVPTAKMIMDHVDQPNVGLCWNSNVSDLEDPGLEQNFNSVRARLSHTTHVRQLDSTDYPFAELIRLFVKTDYQGWLLLEAGGKKPPEDRIQAMIYQRELFESMVAAARK
jgi:hypothetical protein